MLKMQLLFCLALAWSYGGAGASKGPERSPGFGNSGQPGLSIPGSPGMLETVLRGGKSRQSRCVRCYEDRYYGSNYDRYSPGGYASRSGDDGRSSWYYSNSGYDRYDRDRDYYRDDRYYSTRPRTYDRYESRGYDERGYGYDNRDRYYSDRYSDRYYDRSRGGGYNSYERDPYDRYYSRYDYRNYRPWDETYRGQSGFDNSGRGYYFATDDENRSQMPYDRERQPAYSSSAASSCGYPLANCPYGDRGYSYSDRGSGYGDRGTKVSSAAIGSDGSRGPGGHTSIMGQSSDGKPSSINGQGSWTYLNDQQDKQNTRPSSGSGGSSGSGSGAAGGNSISGNRDRERDPQSSSYGGRPRPLGGSYLFDRDSNAVSEGQADATNAGAATGVSNGDGNGGGMRMPVAAAQTAPIEAASDENSVQPDKTSRQ